MVLPMCFNNDKWKGTACLYLLFRHAGRCRCFPVFSCRTRKVGRFFACVVLAGILFLGGGFGERCFAGEKGRRALLRSMRYASDEILVKYRNAAGPAFSSELKKSKRWRRKVLRMFRNAGIHRVQIPAGMTVSEAIANCQDDPDVAYVEPNYVRHLSDFPNDPGFSDQWGLDNTGQTGGALGADINAVQAWDIQTGQREVVVAVIDTGADLDHEDLHHNIWKNTAEDWHDGNPGHNGVDDDGNGRIDDYYGWDFANEDNMPDDDYGHGSHVCGIIGATGDNGIGVTGVNWDVSIMPLKILDSKGNGTVADEIEAIEYAIENGAQIINASYTGFSYSYMEHEAIKDARNAGVLFVAAAGNKGTSCDQTPAYPSSHGLANIVSVAATDHRDALASFSNYGPLSVDVAAPGKRIMSTYGDNTYRSANGTSMAAPYVSGLAALVWAEDVAENGTFTISYGQVKSRIFNGVEVLSSLSGTILSAGRINAYNSLIPVDPTQIPEAPYGLSAENSAYLFVELTWADDSFSESGFKIFRASAAGGPYDHVGTVRRNGRVFEDTTPRDGSVNYYKVKAFNRHGESDASNIASVTIPLAAPSNLVAVAKNEGWINLHWNDNSAVETGYVIEEKRDEDKGFSTIQTVGPNAVSYSRKGLDPSSSYTYRIRATDKSGFSKYSNEASALAQVLPEAPAPEESGTNSGHLSSAGGGGGGGCFIDTVVAMASWL